MAKHAILSPSAASRWMTCTPSARLEENYPNKTSAFAEEGTLAHSLGEFLIKERLYGLDPDGQPQWQAMQLSEYYNDAMLEYCDDYAVFVIEQFSAAQVTTPDAVIHLEKKLNMTDYVPEGFGTGDVVIVANDCLTLIDLKYGKGVPVSATNNSQLKLYALGALRDYDMLFDITTVRMVIYQPRIGNISEWEISVADLLEWANTELKPRAAMAFAGEGEYKAGAHCQFCKAKPECRALAELNLELAKYDFADPNLLRDDEISDILNRADLFTNWVKAVEEHALDKAIAGKKWPGYKLVEGRSNRKITNPEKLLNDLTQFAFYPEQDVTEPKKLLGITKLEKVVTKNDMESFVKEYIIKPQGKPTLAPITDKRPGYNSLASAVADFS